MNMGNEGQRKIYPVQRYGTLNSQEKIIQNSEKSTRKK